MATVQIADIYNPTTFDRRTQEAQTEKNAFLASGVAVRDLALEAQVAQGGRAGELTNFNPLTTGEPDYTSDNPSSSSTPANIDNQVQKFRVSHRAKSWSTMDLARELALQDPVGAITGRIGAYWGTDDQKRCLYSLVGVLNDNEANDAGDMLIDVATDASDAVADTERIGGARVIDALQTLGDHKDSITTLAVHSAIHARLQKQQLIDYIRDADNNIMFETYMGKRLIVDDGLPTTTGDERVTYTCMMFGPGVIANARGRVMVPSEMDRNPAAGDGGGQDIIHSRVANVWHPVGFSFESATLNGAGSTQANYSDLQLAANWDRKYDRKNVPLVFIKVND